MRIQDFNAKPGAPAAQAADPAVPAAKPAAGLDVQAGNVVALQPHLSAPDGRVEAELALLRARIEHLELVIETARGLMTANQERLLRRLHDMPREVASLTLRLGRLSGGAEPDLPGWGAAGLAMTSAARGGQA